MSKYTTGEMAKLCNVTIRTVQYYDSRNILVPSELSEGGRRLYSDEDLRRLQIICFLRDLGLPINTIGQLLREEHPESVISILLEEQKKELSSEIEERQEKMNLLSNLEKELKFISHFSIDSIGDVAQIMENRKNLRKTHRNMLIMGL
ncbi:MAG: MerR family transcriptional regulator, partial [Agathobacter sp.]